MTISHLEYVMKRFRYLYRGDLGSSTYEKVKGNSSAIAKEERGRVTTKTFFLMHVESQNERSLARKWRD